MGGYTPAKVPSFDSINSAHYSLVILSEDNTPFILLPFALMYL